MQKTVKSDMVSRSELKSENKMIKSTKITHKPLTKPAIELKSNGISLINTSVKGGSNMTGEKGPKGIDFYDKKGESDTAYKGNNAKENTPPVRNPLMNKKNQNSKKVSFHSDVIVYDIPNNNVKQKKLKKKQIKRNKNKDVANITNNINTGTSGSMWHSIEDLILKIKNTKHIHKKIKNYETMIRERRILILKYKSKDKMNKDLQLLKINGNNTGANYNAQISDKLLVYNLSYKETEETIEKYFSHYGKIEKVIMEKNKKGICTGKATVTILGNKISQSDTVYKMSGRILRIEKLRRE